MTRLKRTLTEHCLTQILQQLAYPKTVIIDESALCR